MILSWNKNLLSFPFLSFPFSLLSCLFPLSSSPPSLLLLSPYSRGKRCRTTGSAHGAVIFALSCWFSRSSFFVKISSHWFEEACSSLRIEQRPLSLSLSLAHTLLFSAHWIEEEEESWLEKLMRGNHHVFSFSKVPTFL